MRNTLVILFFISIFIGCSSSTQTRREETTTTRQVDTLIMVSAIQESGLSGDYIEWRKWLLPILAFSPDTIQPTAHFATADSSVSVSLNLRTGRTTIEAKPKPVRAKINETTTHVKQETQKETESWLSEFGSILMWVSLILIVLLIAYIIIKPKF